MTETQAYVLKQAGVRRISFIYWERKKSKTLTERIWMNSGSAGSQIWRQLQVLFQRLCRFIRK